MTLCELDTYFNGFLKKENFPSDPSRNGIQIANSAPESKPITKVAFAVDACDATAKQAAQAGAQLLFVHHGLFWGGCDTITGIHYKRIKAFLENDLALYASHIPLDANAEVGNNYGIAARLGLQNVQPFGSWRGMSLGAMGTLPKPLSIDELERALFPNGEKAAHLFPFGKKEIRTVAVISGGAGEDFDQAVAAGADAYITGEVSHEDYHPIEESGINVIAGGHYQTETVGVNLVRAKLEKDCGLETVFIDIPTRL
ncbi:MAG: Nif3-like dinuclear metal center hexameric protein [Treponema sp.]|nr:Nif3-like dinuclear metal center hexameric protein [Treponema sp.]